MLMYVHPTQVDQSDREGHEMTNLEPTSAPAVDPNREGNTPDEQFALQNMRAQGEATEQEIIVDYWGYEHNERWYLPGQERIAPQYKMYLEVRRMTEGVRQSFQKKTNSRVTILKENQNAEMAVDPARDRRELIKHSVVGWLMFRKDPAGKPYTIEFNNRVFEDWLDQADPRIVDELEKFIRTVNPWMLDQMSLESIDKEIDRLTELRVQVKQREDEKALFPDAS